MIGATYMPGTDDGGPHGDVIRDEDDGSAFGVLQLVTVGTAPVALPGWVAVNLGRLDVREQIGYLRELARTADELADKLVGELTSTTA